MDKCVYEPESRLLIDAAAIAARIVELGSEITAYYDRRELTVVTVLNGAMIFTADLVRQIRLPLCVDTIAAASYVGQQSSGRLQLRAATKLDPRGRTILLIDDILDSGCTLARLLELLRDAGAAEVRCCVLLDKAVPRHPAGLPHADFTAFTTPPGFVVGYGLDADERWRNLPDLRVLDA